MNLEIIITTILAMFTSLIPFFYKNDGKCELKYDQSLSAISCFNFRNKYSLSFYSLVTYGLLETLFLIIVYAIIVCSIFLTQYLIKLNSK